MVWTRKRFDDEAKALSQSLLKCDHAMSKEFSLYRWEVQENENGIYLDHPSIAMNIQKNLPNTTERASYEDDSIILDTEQLFTRDIASSQGSKQCLFWEFSVVYSETYQVPILYFHVQDPNGTPCSRDEIVAMLRPFPTSTSDSESNESLIGDLWEFVSQEQHPHTGYPSYFLHPCQTAQRLKLMEVANGIDNTDLWSWMSMILPAVNHSIPSKLYQQVKNALPPSENLSMLC